MGASRKTTTPFPKKRATTTTYVRFEEGGQYPIYCRRVGSPDGPEEVLLDVNLLAEGRDYTRVSDFENSPDHRLAAYGVDFDGSEQFTIRVLDLETGEKPWPTRFPIPTTAWSGPTTTGPSTTRFSTSTTGRSTSIAIPLALIPAADELVYQEEDPRFFVGCGQVQQRTLHLYRRRRQQHVRMALPGR